MGDEKAPAQPGEKKADKPPAPAPQAAPKDQHTGPGRDAGQKQAAGPEPAKPAGGRQAGGQQATPAGQAAAMQKSVGNQQVNRLMRAAREPASDPHAVPGVKVSHPGDAAEKEAEAVAKRVTGGGPAHSGKPGAVPGDPPKVVGDPEVAHRAVAPGAAAHQHPAAPNAGAPHQATNHPAAATPQHPAPAGPNPASVLDHPGPGQPIPQPTRGTLEATLKADLSRVVVHHDAAADQAVRALHARAVTKGDHIFLASDASPNDLTLMAHEVTHVLHHQGDVVHRDTGGTGTPTTQTNGPPPTKFEDPQNRGTIYFLPSQDKDKENKKTIEIAEAPYVDEKYLSDDVQTQFDAGTKIYRDRKQDNAGKGTKQDSRWLGGLKSSRDTVTKKIEDLIQGAATIPAPEPPTTPGAAPAPAPKSDSLFLLRFGPGGSSSTPTGAKLMNGVIIGTKSDLVAAALWPYWDREHKFNPMNIDHVVEIQVGGEDEYPNYWLWEAVANQNAGNDLKGALRTKVTELLTAATREFANKPGMPTVPKDRDSLDETEWRIKVKALKKGALPARGKPKVYWKRSEVESGAPVDKLSRVTEKEARDLGLSIGGSAGFLTIVVGSRRGGALVRVPWKPTQPVADGPSVEKAFDEIYPGFRVKEVVFDKDQPTAKTNRLVGTLRPPEQVRVPTADIELPLTGFGKQPKDVPIAQVLGQELAKQVGNFDFAGMSPITITEAGLEAYTGFTARGVLQPSIPILRDHPIDVVFSGGGISLEKTFGASSLPVPAPLKVTGGAVTVSAGTKGFRVGGTVTLALGTIATGTVTASVDSKLNFALDGGIDFDKTLFQPANLTFFYHKTGSDHDWGISGTLGIPQNKVPGIQKGSITASYSNGKFAAGGEATLSVPGLQSGSLMITYAEQEGIAIGGKFALAPNPAVESGSVDATVTKRPPGDRWALSVHGTVKPKIPGIDTTLSASYEDGVFTVEGSVAYARGMLSGSLTVGLTNRPLDPQSQPSGGSGAGASDAAKPHGAAPHADGPLRPYGGGTLTAKIAPWLEGTAGVQIQKDGSVQLTGEIKLPDSVNLFDPMEVKKNLFTIGVDIPIVGVSVAGQRIGVFATIQGGLEASAGIGPGQLKQLGLKVRYNPDHEDQTQITGTAQLAIPAHAGLRLYVRGGLGAGIPIVSAEAGLEIGGKLGVEGAVQAGVTVNWTPKQGLVIDAEASLSAEPSFTFDVNGYVKVSADLLFTTVNLYEKHWQLASFAYGSGLRVGVRAPIHYEQGKPFGFSLSDVQFDLPKIDPMHVLTDLVHQIA